MAQGDDVVAGETNPAYNPTEVLGTKQGDEGPTGDFVVPTGKLKSIFSAFPHRDRTWTPDLTLDGVTGIGNAKGAGVKGVGGLDHGPGVLGLGSRQLFPEGDDSGGNDGGSGVVGFGGNAHRGDVPADVPPFPAPGVVGRGGTEFKKDRDAPEVPTGRGGAGVVGESGEVAALSDTDGLRAIHTTQVGTIGFADSGIGAVGISRRSRGGVFASGADSLAGLLETSGHPLSEIQPQLRLIPPTGNKLPKHGLLGDLILGRFEDENEVGLWLCVQGSEPGSAKWRLVTVGDLKTGTV